MSQHVTRTIHPRGFHRGFRGFGSGLGSGMFDLGLTVDPGGSPVSQSVQSAELAVTGTFAARAPTLLNQAAAYQTEGMVTKPSVQYADGTVVTSDGVQNRPPAGWSPDPSTWGSPTDAITGSQRQAGAADQSAIDNQLDPSAMPQGTPAGGQAVDGQWYVAPDGTLVQAAPAAQSKMKWWHWGLIGAAVLGGGYALAQILTK